MKTDNVRQNGRSFDKLPYPITFTCVVDSHSRKATITHRDKVAPDNVYLISFDDGHQGTFFLTGSETKVWFEEELVSSPYAKAVSDDLSLVRSFDPLHPPFAIRLRNEDEVFNVWFKPDAGTYSVYYKGLLRFALYPTNLGWETMPMGYAKAEVNEELVTVLVRHLPSQIP